MLTKIFSLKYNCVHSSIPNNYNTELQHDVQFNINIPNVNFTSKLSIPPEPVFKNMGQQMPVDVRSLIQNNKEFHNIICYCSKPSTQLQKWHHQIHVVPQEYFVCPQNLMCTYCWRTSLLSLCRSSSSKRYHKCRLTIAFPDFHWLTYETHSWLQRMGGMYAWQHHEYLKSFMGDNCHVMSSSLKLDNNMKGIKGHILWWIGTKLDVGFHRCTLKFQTKFSNSYT